MTPKLKAKELVDKYWIYLRAGLLYDEEAKDDAKHCASIAVEEIEEALTDYGRGDSFQLQNMDSEFRFWEQVKTEIEKL
jgi:hypothetical protein